MKSEYKVTSNVINRVMMYAVYRLKDVNEPDHSGNREFATEFMEDKEKALKIAAELNGK